MRIVETHYGLVLTDTVGRPWRQGIADIAIGGAGIETLHDLRGVTADTGATLHTTIRNVAKAISCSTGAPAPPRPRGRRTR